MNLIEIFLYLYAITGYVGDMLAWLHQMTPTEKENAQALLKGCDKSGECYDIVIYFN